jgi:hypothetical protein
MPVIFGEKTIKYYLGGQIKLEFLIMLAKFMNKSL